LNATLGGGPAKGEDEAINEYGLVHASYSGEGTLFGAQGEEESCSFCVFQLRDGCCVALTEVRDPDPVRALQFNTATSLVGATSDDRPLTATGLFETTYLPPIAGENNVVCRAHICREIDVGDALSDASSKVSRFAVTNLCIVKAISINHPAARAQAVRVTEYADRSKRLQFSKAVDVTSELLVESTNQEPRNRVAQDICNLLSLAQGCRVQWISRVDYSSSGVASHWYHASLVTKPYVALPIVDPRRSDDTARFLDVALPVFLRRGELWNLNQGLLDAYLDAKSEVDFLQLRGVKLAVTLEMLKACIIGVEGIREFVRPKAEFTEIVPLLRTAVHGILVDQGWQNTERAVAYANLQGLNRFPFRSLVEALCSEVGLTLTEEDLRLFVKCRNSLVHRCRFYCETADDEDRRNCRPHDTKEEEYFWLLHVMDRLFLRTVGYDGPWIDWSIPGNPQRRDRLLDT